MKIGVQLYTLRSLMEDDLWGTMAKLADAGFKNVELAGLYDKPVQEWAEKLGSLGLQVSSSHTGITEVEGDISPVIELTKTLGYSTLVCPWVPAEAYAGGWTALGKRLDLAGQKLAEHGIQYGYHNHSFEMVKVGLQTGLEQLFAASSGANVIAEVDTYWIHHGGGDPAAYIQNLSGRIPLVHFKDMSEEGHFTEVGAGVLDWDDIIDSCRIAGVEHAIIENDSPRIDPLESVCRSREFLLSKGLKD